MKLLSLAIFLFPLLLEGQAAVERPYNDSLFAPGAAEGSDPVGVPMKLKIYGKRVVAPRVLISTLFAAGLQQYENTPGKWGRGADGYAKRYGTDLARVAIRDTFAFGVDSAFHLDPRFYRAPDSTSASGRLKHALVQVLIAHTDSGGRSFAYGTVAGAFVAGEAGTLWMPRRSDGKFGDGLVYAGLLLAGDAGRNVFREFWPSVHRKLRLPKP